MKKFIFAFIAIMIVSIGLAQSTTPRYSITKNGDNSGRVISYGYLTPTPSATMNIAPNYYSTLVSVPSLTISPTYSFVAKNGHADDRVTIITGAASATRTITLSGAAVTSASTFTVGSSKQAIINFVFDGVNYIETSRVIQP